MSEKTGLLEQDDVGQSVISAILGIQQLYPDDTTWTTNVKCDVPEPVDFRITRLLYVASERAGFLDIEMY